MLTPEQTNREGWAWRNPFVEALAWPISWRPSIVRDGQHDARVLVSRLFLWIRGALDFSNLFTDGMKRAIIIDVFLTDGS